MNKHLQHFLQGAPLALLLGTAAYTTSCSDKSKSENMVAPKAAATTADALAPGDPAAYPTDYAGTEAYAQTTGNCSFPRVSQNGTFNTGYQVYYVPGQKVRLMRDRILSTGCTTPSTCEIWLMKGQTYMATLQTGFNPASTGTTMDVTLPTNLPFGEDYQIIYGVGNTPISGAVNSMTIYIAKQKLMTVTPSNVSYPNGSTVTASWPGWAWVAGHPINVYVYGFGPLLTDNTRTLVGSTTSPGTGTAYLSFPAPATGGSFSLTRQWIVRIQDGQNNVNGNSSMAQNTTY